MSFRNDLAGVLARDPRYTIHAYAFVFDQKGLMAGVSLEGSKISKIHPKR